MEKGAAMTIAQDLLQAARAIDEGRWEGCCYAIETIETSDYFESYFKPQTSDERLGRYNVYWMSSLDTTHNENRAVRVLGLLVAREIWMSEQRLARCTCNVDWSRKGKLNVCSQHRV